MRGTMQKRIALLVVAILFFLALIPAFYPVEDEVLSKGSSVYSAYNQLFTAFNSACEFDCHLGWTRNSSILGASWYLPSVLHSSTETRAPPA
jgi:hypothetical protein